jgi:hypothetical protein
VAGEELAATLLRGVYARNEPTLIPDEVHERWVGEDTFNQTQSAR